MYAKGILNFVFKKKEDVKNLKPLIFVYPDEIGVCKSRLQEELELTKALVVIYHQTGKHESLEGKTNHLSTLNIFVKLVAK